VPVVGLILMAAYALLIPGFLTGWASRSAAAQGRAVPRWYRHHRWLLAGGAALFAVAVVLAFTAVPPVRVLLGPTVVLGLLVVAELVLRRRALSA
jgi:hypothetical protein